MGRRQHADSETQNADGASTGDARLEITGYGFTGQVAISSNDPGHVTVTAKLMRRDE